MFVLANRFVKYFTSNTTLLMVTLYNKNNSLILLDKMWK